MPPTPSPRREAAALFQASDSPPAASPDAASGLSLPTAQLQGHCGGRKTRGCASEPLRGWNQWCLPGDASPCLVQPQRGCKLFVLLTIFKYTN